MGVAGVLEGVTILDLASEIAGPYACMLMAGMGARVIKVEPPLRDSSDLADPRFFLWNRGKESVTLDLAQPSGREAVRRLATRADILVHCWRPSQAEALGLGYETLHSVSPRLIYCAVPPYPAATPLADVPGDAYSVASAMGILADQGAPDGPTFVYAPLAAYGAAFTLCLATTTALLTREATGVGQKVEVSLAHGAMAVQSAAFVSGLHLRGRGSSLRQGIRVGIPVYRLFAAQDGWFFLACGNNTFFNKLCLLLGRPELAEDERYRDAPWGIPPEHYDSLADILEPIFVANTLGHWMTLLAENDIPCGPVQERPQFLRHPQLALNQTLSPVEDPALGQTLQMGLPLWMHGAPGVALGPAPRSGEHTTRVLREFGIRVDEQ
ncbi:MAG: CoA transferase [Chloroflexi bacterium]|nr:CoA transferase [Chloroflexota bacterium]